MTLYPRPTRGYLSPGATLTTAQGVEVPLTWLRANPMTNGEGLRVQAEAHGEMLIFNAAIEATYPERWEVRVIALVSYRAHGWETPLFDAVRDEVRETP